MEVGDGFAAVGAVVDHQAESFIQAHLFGQIAADEHQVPEHGTLFVGCLGDPVDPFFGYDQEMDRGLRVDVADDDAPIVLELDLGRNLTIDDTGEEGRFGHEKKGLDQTKSSRTGRWGSERARTNSRIHCTVSA